MNEDEVIREIVGDIECRFNISSRYVGDNEILLANSNNDQDSCDRVLTKVIEYIREHYDCDADYTVGYGTSIIEIIL